MERKKVSLIFAAYKDVRALEPIVNPLRMQTYKNFELVVAEGKSDPGIKNYLETVADIEPKHTARHDIWIGKSHSVIETMKKRQENSYFFCNNGISSHEITNYAQ